MWRYWYYKYIIFSCFSERKFRVYTLQRKQSLVVSFFIPGPSIVLRISDECLCTVLLCHNTQTKRAFPHQVLILPLIGRWLWLSRKYYHRWMVSWSGAVLPMSSGSSISCILAFVASSASYILESNCWWRRPTVLTMCHVKKNKKAHIRALRRAEVCF